MTTPLLKNTTTSAMRSTNTVTPPPTHEKQAPPPWLQEVAVIDHGKCPCCNHVNSQQTIEQEEVDQNPGVLKSGITYTPKRCLAEGYIHLKGSGQDWFGSRAWKPRYARLVLATVQGVDTPLLLIYWFQSSVEPSTVITLDSTVVIPVDKDDKTLWNAYSLNVVHVSSKLQQRTTRCFTAGSSESRDQWLLVLNQALLQYEKNKARHHKQNKCMVTTMTTTCPKSSMRRSFSEERFLTMSSSSSSSSSLFPPPNVSPMSSMSEKRPLPRPELPLAGEFLDEEDNYWLAA